MLAGEIGLSGFIDISGGTLPFSSKSQMRYMYAAHPKIAKKMSAGMKKKHMSFKSLPNRVKKKKTR